MLLRLVKTSLAVNSPSKGTLYNIALHCFAVLAIFDRTCARLGVRLTLCLPSLVRDQS